MSEPTQVIEVRTVPSHAGVSVKLTRSVQGVSLEVDVNRLREAGEDYDAVARDAARLAELAYREGQEAATRLGLVLGKEPSRG